LNEFVRIPDQHIAPSEPLPEQIWRELHLQAQYRSGRTLLYRDNLTQCGWETYRATPMGPRQLFVTKERSAVTCAACLQEPLW
jgi:hypothetical protein